MKTKNVKYEKNIEKISETLTCDAYENRKKELLRWHNGGY